MTTNKAAALVKFLERKLQQPDGLSSIKPELLELAVKNARADDDDDQSTTSGNWKIWPGEDMISGSAPDQGCLSSVNPRFVGTYSTQVCKMESPVQAWDIPSVHWSQQLPRSQKINTENSQTVNMCENCGGDDLRNENGYFYCHNCGTQSQNLIEMTVADEDIFGTDGNGALYNTSIFARNASQSHDTALPLTREEILEALAGAIGDDDKGCEKEKEERNYRFVEDEDDVVEPMDFGAGPDMEAEEMVDAIRTRYVQGLQVMIQIQCEALVENCKVNPIICSIVGHIWLKFVAASRVFDDEWAATVVKESEEVAREKAGEEKPKYRSRQTKEERCEPHNMYGKRLIMIWSRSLKKVIPLHSTLAISFLACHVARLSILPTDIVKWASEAKLPYISAFSVVDKLLQKSPKACRIRTRTLFRPHHVIGPWDLEAMSGYIAKCIGLVLPPVNFSVISRRFLQELHLPLEKIHPFACRVYEWSMPVELCLASNDLRLPTRVHVMAILIVAIRILYKINGEGVWEKNLACSTCVHRGEQLQDHKSLTSVMYAEIGESRTGNISLGLISEYDTVELLYNLETAYHEMSSSRHDYSKDFSSYLKYCKNVIFTGISKTREEETLVEKLWEIYEKQDNKEPGGTTDSNQKISREEVKSGFDGHAVVKSQTEELASIKAVSRVSNEDLALNSLKLDMEENGFHYLPPKRQISDYYLHYKRKQSWGVNCYVAHADYYILLRAFARLAEVDCRVVHNVVLSFERRITWIEKRIRSSLLSIRDGSVEAMIEASTKVLENLLD